MMVIEIDLYNFIKYEEMYVIVVEGFFRCVVGEVILEVVMFIVEEVFVFFIWNDIEIERDGIFFCISLNVVKFL